MTLEEDKTRAMKPATGTADWNFDSDLDDAMLADEEDDPVQQFAVPAQPVDANNWNASDADDDSLTNMWRQFSPILAPVPFALIIFLFSLLANSRGVAYLPPLPLGIILLALVVIQGTLLYYAGNNDTFWTLSMAGGYLLFLLVGAFVFFGLSGALVLLVIILVLGVIFGSRAIRQVPEGQVDLVHMFGRYHRTLYPGLNLLFPWERVYARTRTKEITWTTAPLHITTSRDQDVDIVAAVTYQLLPEDAHIAVLHIADWETDLHQHFLGVLKSVVYELKPADFIGWAHDVHSRPQVVDELANPRAETRWDRLNAALLRRLQDQVATRGIKINMVHIQDITVITRHASSIMPVDAGMVRGQPIEPVAMPATLSVHQAAIAAQPTAQPAPVVLPTAAAAPASPPILKDTKLQSMIDTFNAIRDGHITDPTIILGLAERFESIANNPEIDRIFPYDAQKAAKVLIDRASYIKASQTLAEVRRVNVPANPIPAPAPVERPARRLPSPSNDNLAAGG